MIATNYITDLLSGLIGLDSSVHIDWAALNARVPDEVKTALQMSLHMTAGVEDLNANAAGALLAGALGGARMAEMYLESVGMQWSSRPVFLARLPKTETIEPALAAAFLLVCSPINAYATIARLGVGKYELPIGPCSPVAQEAPE